MSFRKVLSLITMILITILILSVFVIIYALEKNANVKLLFVSTAILIFLIGSLFYIASVVRKTVFREKTVKDGTYILIGTLGSGKATMYVIARGENFFSILLDESKVKGTEKKKEENLNFLRFETNKQGYRDISVQDVYFEQST